MKAKPTGEKAATKYPRYVKILRYTGFGFLWGAVLGIPLAFLGSWLGFVEVKPSGLQECVELAVYGALIEGLPGAGIGFLVGCFA